MPSFSSVAKKLQFFEYALPPRWRLPARYRGQRLVNGLEPEMSLLDRLVPAGGFALDIGANRGVYAYALAGIAGSVHCFEPLIECCKYVEAYGSEKIAVHNVALSDGAGAMRLYIPIMNGKAVPTRASLERPQGAFESRDIEVRTLDSYEFQRLDFIKMDVEGLEAAVLRGGAATLRRHMPAMLIEIDRARHSANSFAAIFESLLSLGYGTHVCADGALEHCADPSNASRKHINFIFIPESKR